MYTISTKRRAWLTFAVSIALSLSCVFYFHKTNGNLDDRRFIYQAMFFVAGGLLFLYKDRIGSMGKIGRIVTLVIAIGALPLLYVSGPAWTTNLRQLVLWVPWMVFAIASDHRIFSNRIAKFFSGISFEIYLSHLFIFQVFNMLHLTHLTGIPSVDYLMTLALVIVGVTGFSVLAKRAIDYGWSLWRKRR